MKQSERCLQQPAQALQSIHSAPSQVKPIKIYSTNAAVQSLYRQKAPGQTSLVTRSKRGVTGKPKALKASQAYPPGFGVAVADMHLYCK